MELDVAEITRYMRMGRFPPEVNLDRRIVELRDALVDCARPARVFARIDLPAVGFGIEESGKLASLLDGCGSAYLLCTTLGSGVDVLMRRFAAVSAIDAFIVQAAGAALIEKWTDLCEVELASALSPGETLRRRYSPGYGDWPLSAQKPVTEYLDTSRRIGVSVTDTLLLTPSKSVTALIGIAKAG